MGEHFKYENSDLRKNIDMKTLKYPISVYFKVTTKCMFNCEFCSQFGKDMKELDINLAKAAFDELKELGIMNIYYTGGEPLLYKDIEELLKYGYNLGFKQILVTNGYLLSEPRIRELTKYLVSIGVSIHGNAEIHNELSRKDCYKQIVTSLRKLQKENTKLAININCTAIDKNTNYENFRFLAELCKENNWKLTIARLNYIGNGKKYENTNLNIMLGIISRLNNEGFNIKISNCIAPCLVDEKYRYLSHGCGAGQSIAAIEANWDVKICASSDYVLGNIKQEKFKNIWNCKENKTYQKMKWLPMECKVCKYFLICKGGCKAELTGEYWKDFCDELVQKRFDNIWKEIENKKLVLNFKNLRKEKINHYATISIPYRICNKETAEILKMIDGKTTTKEIIGRMPRYSEKIKNLLIALKADNLIDIIK